MMSAKPKSTAHASLGKGPNLTWPSRPAMAALLGGTLLLLIAPPNHNAFWAVNGLRSIDSRVELAVLAAALASGVLAWRPPRGRLAVSIALPALALTLAIPLGEVLHHLGDTFSRWGAIAEWVHATGPQPFLERARQLHAQPVDAALWLLVVGAVTPSDVSPAAGIGFVSALLGVVYLAGAWRIARILDAGRGLAWGLWLAMIMNGGLLAFASYAESAPVMLATSVWFWAALLVPLDSVPRATATVGTWVLAALAHRTGLALLVPLALRLVGPGQVGDVPGLRRATAVAAAVAAIGVTVVNARFGAGQLGSDLRELLQGPAQGAWASLPSDVPNLLILIAPLALLAPALAGGGLRRVAADARSLPLVLAGLLYLPLVFPLPVAGSGLGYHRDWDLALPLALALTLLSARALAELPAARLRGAQVATVPLLVLIAGGWLAVNRDPAASLARVEALVNGAPRIGPMQRSSALLYLGDYSLAMGRPAEAARRLEESWLLVASPARGLHTVLAWVQAGEPDSAERVLRVLRADAGLPPHAAADADSLEAAIQRLRPMPGP